MLTLKLKQAECALADGRLDEAYEVLTHDSVRQHRKGQDLAGRLARALVERGHQHLSSDRIQQALADCNKADKIAGNQSQIAQLRTAACDRLNQQHFAHQQREQKLAQAQRYLKAGQLSAAQQVMSAVEQGHANILSEEAQVLRVEIESALNGMHTALADQDLERALDSWASLSGRIPPTHTKVTDLLKQIKVAASSQIRTLLNQGRIDRAQGLLLRLEAVNMTSSETEEFNDVLGFCVEAAQAVEQHQPDRVARTLAKLKLILPEATWIDTMAQQARQADEALQQLSSGPLGLIKMNNQIDKPIVTVAHKVQNSLAPPVSIEPPQTTPTLDEPLVLQVNGVGSFLILPQNPVTIGPISGNTRPHLGLLTDPHLPAITLQREDEDYIVQGSGPIRVNQNQTTKRLLADGDRIALSDRCRMKFNQPNAASTTATLSISGARLARPDINYCILMDRDLLIGDQTSHHIRVPQLDQPVALLQQNGQLICRAAAPVMSKGHALSSSQGLPLDTPLTVGELSLVLTRYST